MKDSNNSVRPTTTVSPRLPARAATSQVRPEAGPSKDEIARKAYSIYLAKGRPPGQDQQHWFEAEAQMFAARKRGGHQPVA